MLVSLNRLFLVLAALLIALPPLKGAAENLDLGGVPLPSDAVVADGGSPFAGAWFGRWGNQWRTALVVEAIGGDKVRAIYAVGPNGSFPGGYRRLLGEVSGDVISLDGPTYTVEFQMSATGHLRGRYNGDQGFAILSRGDLQSDHPWSVGVSEMIVTDLVEEGQPVRLETVIYKPDGDGPFPLAVMNHGSTGQGNDPATFGLTWSDAWLADLLVARGWLVAFPQRRGRGASDGLYDEGFTRARSFYTCDAEPSLKGADRALNDISAAIRALRQRPDVETSPVLMGGISRGGVLSVAWAGRNPEQTHGVVNFVGGWLSEGCGDADQANQKLFRAGGAYKGQTLWLYGDDDTFYSLPYSRRNFAAFTDAGGNGAFHEFALNGDGNGHWVHSVPTLWDHLLMEYLDALN